jgi:AraC-like DNA-binding protein
VTVAPANHLVIGFLEIEERGLMSIDLTHVRDANRRRFSATGPLASAALGRLRQMRGGNEGETNSAEAGRLASQSSAIRLKLSGAEAVLSISMESSRADLVLSPNMIDLRESELGGEHLTAIMRWLSERLQVHSDALRPLAPTGLTKWRLKRVLTYIDEHICESITLATLARVAGLSRMYFAAQFRAATGCRPHECILRKRIELAQQLLLETSESLVSISLAVGFQSQAHFSTVFKRFAGLPPNQWRAANRDLSSLGRVGPPEGKTPDGGGIAARCSAPGSAEVPTTRNLMPSVISQFPKLRPDAMTA